MFFIILGIFEICHMTPDRDTYLTLASSSDGQFRDRGSRFLSFAWPVVSEEEIKQKLNEIKKKYHDARHHCYAFRLNPESGLYRYSDDGEPSGTAGRPIYEQILSADLFEVMIVVVRYFGGILLGTGGLYNAYKQAAKDATRHATFTEKFIEKTLRLSFGYDLMNRVMQILSRERITPVMQDFGEACLLEIKIRKNRLDTLTRIFSSLDNLKIEKL